MLYLLVNRVLKPNHVFALLPFYYIILCRCIIFRNVELISTWHSRGSNCSLGTWTAWLTFSSIRSRWAGWTTWHTLCKIFNKYHSNFYLLAISDSCSLINALDKRLLLVSGDHGFEKISDSYLSQIHIKY